jgi:hypothetical protein
MRCLLAPADRLCGLDLAGLVAANVQFEVSLVGGVNSNIEIVTYKFHLK